MKTYESDTEKRVFVYRQRMKNVDEPAVAYELKLELPEGAERVTLYRIDKDHCNPKRIWEEMGSPKEISPAEIEEIKAKSALVAETVEPEIEGKTLTLSGRLEVNDVHCYVVKVK